MWGLGSTSLTLVVELYDNNNDNSKGTYAPEKSSLFLFGEERDRLACFVHAKLDPVIPKN